MEVYSYLYDKDGFLDKIIIGFHVFEYKDDPNFGQLEDGYTLYSELTPQEMVDVVNDEANLKAIAEKYAVIQIKNGMQMIAERKIKEENVLSKVNGDAGKIHDELDAKIIEEELKK